MITVFSRGSNVSAPSGNSARFSPDAFPGASWLDSGAQNALRIQDTSSVGGDGLTFATWVKPNWDNGTQGAPAMFMELETLPQAPLFDNYIARFGYDSETTLDSIFLYLKYYIDGNPHSLWINAPLDDITNQGITGLTPTGLTNTWNSVTSPDFVHVAVILDMTTQSWPEFTTDISPRARIFWNGQVLNTYENFSTSPSYLNLIRFTEVDPKLYIGPKIWNRAHCQDRVIYNTYPASASDVLNHYYAGQTPLDPPPTADFHWNFETGSTQSISNGVGNPFTIIRTAVSPGILPDLDSVNFV